MPKPWAVIGTDMIPIGDLVEHVPSPACQCCPRVQDGVTIHNSRDGREIIEGALYYAYVNQS